MESVETVSTTTSTCFECTNSISPSAIRVKRIKRLYCRQCWINHCDFRVRKRVYQLARPEKGSRRSSSNLFRPNEQVLIDYDGSESALALLNIIRETLLSEVEAESSSSTKSTLNMPFKFSISFIYDEIGSNKEAMTKDLNLLRTWQAQAWSKFGLDFPIILSSLESGLTVINRQEGENSRVWRTLSHNQDSVEVMEHENTKIELNTLPFSLPFDTSLNAQLSKLMKNLKSQTSKLELARELRRNLLMTIGSELKNSIILVPEDQTTMAIKMFTTMSLGRGAQLADEMGFTTQIQGIKFARPLMDLTSNDLRDYMECMDSDPKSSSSTTYSQSETSMPLPIDKQEPTENKAIKNSKVAKSIEAQCEEFIVDLQEGYPSTVPTLTRIGAKLQCSTSAGEGGEDIVLSPCRLCKRNRETNEEEADEEVEGLKALCLCYGCANILRDMKDPSLFIDFIRI